MHRRQRKVKKKTKTSSPSCKIYDTSSIEEARIAHNMIFNQVAAFSPLCIDMPLDDCTEIDNCLANYYHNSLEDTSNLMQSTTLPSMKSLVDMA
jgi:hypothetical protein